MDFDRTGFTSKYKMLTIAQGNHGKKMERAKINLQQIVSPGNFVLREPDSSVLKNLNFCFFF